MLLRSLSPTSWKKLQKLIIFIFVLTLLPQTAIAEDQRLESALKGLDAAMKRIDALETKVGKMSSLEEENKQLKNRLVKLETMQQPIKVTSQRRLVPVEQPAVIQAVATSIPSATPEISSKETWQGAYFGLNAGYGANTINQRDLSIYSTYYSVRNNTILFGGPLVGLTAGYNEMLNSRVMLGVETDASWANIYNLLNSSSSSLAELSYNYVYNYSTFPYRYQLVPFAAYNSTYNRVSLDALGTARFRIGYTFGNFMPYLTGGVSYGMVSNEYRSGFATTPNSNWSAGRIYTETDAYKVRVAAGWAAGAGAEYKLANNWSTKLEYLYTSFGDINFYSGTTSFGNFGIHQVRIGLNYHTDWLKELPVSLR
jgi:outer membrane immunogenic protein